MSYLLLLLLLVRLQPSVLEALEASGEHGRVHQAVDGGEVGNSAVYICVIVAYLSSVMLMESSVQGGSIHHTGSTTPALSKSCCTKRGRYATCVLALCSVTWAPSTLRCSVMILVLEDGTQLRASKQNLQSVEHLTIQKITSCWCLSIHPLAAIAAVAQCPPPSTGAA